MSTASGYDQPLPDAFGHNDGTDAEFAAKPLVELEMTRLSAEIRRRPLWWTKFRDPETLARWRAGALAQTKLMKESHVDYVLKELDGYANLRDEQSGAEVACYDRIWQSDKLIPDGLRAQLMNCVSRLENVPEAEKDWHPRSNGQVLDLVHPSLYPIVYGRTLSYPEDSDDRDPSKLEARLKPPGRAAASYWQMQTRYHTSRKFQWLPTDFKVSADGKSVESDGYINNLHPVEHAELHKTVEELISSHVPLFERVLTDGIPFNQAVPERTNNRCYYDLSNYPPRPSHKDFSEDDGEYDRECWAWEQGRQIILPAVPERGYELGTREKRDIKYTLGGRTIQVIVKLANIHLTPEKPTYSGGSWRIEGMKNEAIAVSSVYCYDEDNVTNSRLAFRTATRGPGPYELNDVRGCVLTWGMNNRTPCVNELGSVITSQGRCIAFPNTYQHRVSPFELVDKSKPGHRKIVALFLIDPAIRRPSTKVVPPQQKDWRTAGIGSNPVLNARFAPEIISLIGSQLDDVITREEAEKYRLELMDERTAFAVKNDEVWFNSPFLLYEQ